MLLLLWDITGHQPGFLYLLPLVLPLPPFPGDEEDEEVVVAWVGGKRERETDTIGEINLQ